MDNKKIIIAFILSILLTSTINAQLCGTSENPCKDSWENFDYTNINADISKIPPEKIDIDKVLANNRGKELTFNQIRVNLEKIPNLKEVDEVKAKSAIHQEYGIDISSFGESAKIESGELKATFGEKDHITLSEIYKNGLLTINKKGEIEFRPNEEISEIKVPSKDSVTIDANNLVKSENGLTFSGRISYKDGSMYVKPENKVLIENSIMIDTKKDNVWICKDSCKTSYDNYVIFSDDKLSAKGNGFSLDFFTNKYLNVKKEIGFGDNDLLKFYIGDFNGKQGELHLTAQGDWTMPLIEHKGYLTIENDINILSIDENKVTSSLFKESERYKQKGITLLDKGSVPLALKVSSEMLDVSSYYAFDENHNVHILEESEFELNNKVRKNLYETFGVQLEGYFNRYELDVIGVGLEDTEETLKIDVSKLKTDEEEAYLKVSEFDRRVASFAIHGELSVDAATEPTTIKWHPSIKIDEDSVKNGVTLSSGKFSGEEITSFYSSAIPHEIGHIINNLNNPITIVDRKRILNDPVEGKNPNNALFTGDFYTKWKQTAEGFGIKLEEKYKSRLGEKVFTGYSIIEGSEYLFPSELSKTKLEEHQAEIFYNMVYYPDWFDNPDLDPISRERRQAFRNLYLEEIKKYKK